MDHKLIYLARRNPSVAIEDWPRTWRSHAKFASQFPVLGARISRLIYCARIDRPAAGGSDGYDGAGIVASPTADAPGGELDPADFERMFEDEDRVFATRTPRSAFRCRETLVEGGAPGRAAILRFLVRRPGLSGADFQARWRDHARLAANAPEVVRHVHNALIEPPPAGFPFDGISETWFDEPAQATGFLATPAAATIVDDLATFCDAARGITLLTHVIHRWPSAR